MALLSKKSATATALAVWSITLAAGVHAEDEPEKQAPDPPGETSGTATKDKTLADALFDQAHAALDQGDWATACAKFQESMRYDISVSTQLNIARCNEHDGKLVEAWHDYNRARAINRTTADQGRQQALAEALEKSVATLETRLPRVRVRIDDPPGEVSISSDGVPTQSAVGEPFPVNPGEHEITIAAAGFRTERRTVTLVEGQTLEIDVALVPGGDPTTTGPAAAPPPLAKPPARVTRRTSTAPEGEPIATWVWPVGAVGVVALGAGIGVAAVSISARSKLADGCTKSGGSFECPDDRFNQDDIDGLVRDANAGLGGALALGAVGIAGITAAAVGIAHKSGRESPASNVSAVPWLATGGGVGVFAHGVF